MSLYLAENLLPSTFLPCSKNAQLNFVKLLRCLGLFTHFCDLGSKVQGRAVRCPAAASRSGRCEKARSLRVGAGKK